jgi:hypothetical protein
MKTKISSIIAITLIVSGMSTFTSCIGVMEDTADSLVDGTYGYYYTPKNAKRIPMAQQQGMAVVVNDGEHLTRTDLAVRLFKEEGFTWGGDEPDGNPNYFTK